MTSFLIGMAWKSTLIAGAALLLLRLLRDSPAAARAALLQFAALLLLLLPALALMLPSLVVAVPESAAPAAPDLSVPPLAAVAAPTSVAGVAQAAAVPSGPGFTETLPFLYVAGAALLLAQLGLGLARLATWTRSASPPDCPRWIAAFDRIRSRRSARRPARLLVSDEVPAPMSWGWRSAAILIDRASVARPDDAPAVLEHEMAHVDRGDWPALMLVRIATALFWFNPLVWLLKRAFVQAAEEAADARAVGKVEPTDYAQMLLGYARQAGRTAVPANPVGANPIGARIEAILSRRSPDGRQGRRLAVAMAGCLAIAAPVAALSLDGDDGGSGAALAAARRDRTAAPVRGVAPPVMLASMQVPQPPEPPFAPEPPEPVDAPEPPAVPYAPEPPLPPAAGMDDLGRTIEQAVAAAERAAREAAVEVERARIEIARIDVEEIRATAMHAAAEGLAGGAEGMEQGAREMADTARRLRTDPDYRLQAWREGNRRGEPLSEAEAIELARKMEEGAARMREGAGEMRRKAAEMRAKQP